MSHLAAAILGAFVGYGLAVLDSHPRRAEPIEVPTSALDRLEMGLIDRIRLEDMTAEDWFRVGYGDMDPQEAGA